MINRKRITTYSVATLLVSLSLVPGAAWAQTYDHYKCYKMKEAGAFNSALLNLSALNGDFGIEDCEIKKGSSKQFCAPVDKAVNTIEDGTLQTVDGVDLDYNMICYKIKCPKGTIAPREVSDQFGTRTIEKFKASKLCVPALTDGLPPPPDPSCGDGLLEAPEECEVDGDCTGGNSCTGACTCIEPSCPSILAWGFHQGGVNEADSGYVGIGHNLKQNSENVLRMNIASVSGTGPSSCGVATLQGIDGSAGNCRCADDQRAICNEPNEFDDDDCGGALCECFLHPAMPTVAGGFPTCVLTRITGDITGTWNLDTGSGEVVIPTDTRARSGIDLLNPCVSCDGDATLGDGARDGTCNGGADDGLPCDAQMSNVTWPAPSGGDMSLDCRTSATAIAVGQGSNLRLTTGNTTLNSNFACGPLGTDMCQCGRCDGTPNLGCTENADCGADGPCSTQSALLPQVNGCSDRICTDTGPVGDGQGTCAAGPSNIYCDGLVRTSGLGYIACNVNNDCVSYPGAGNCTLVEDSPCFMPTISATGIASTTFPYIVSAECSGLSSNPGANTASGYPGPGFRRHQVDNIAYCAGSPASTYPGCP